MDVMRYAVIKYPESSLLSNDNIDNVILTGANLWKNDHVEIVKNLDDNHANDIEIVFCDFTECLVGFSSENDSEELAGRWRRTGRRPCTWTVPSLGQMTPHCHSSVMVESCISRSSCSRSSSTSSTMPWAWSTATG